MKDIIIVRIGDKMSGTIPTEEEIQFVEEKVKKAYAEAGRDVVVIAFSCFTEIQTDQAQASFQWTYSPSASNNTGAIPPGYDPGPGVSPAPIDLTPQIICGNGGGPGWRANHPSGNHD